MPFPSWCYRDVFHMQRRSFPLWLSPTVFCNVAATTLVQRGHPLHTSHWQTHAVHVQGLLYELRQNARSCASMQLVLGASTIDTDALHGQACVAAHVSSGTGCTVARARLKSPGRILRTGVRARLQAAPQLPLCQAAPWPHNKDRVPADFVCHQGALWRACMWRVTPSTS